MHNCPPISPLFAVFRRSNRLPLPSRAKVIPFSKNASSVDVNEESVLVQPEMECGRSSLASIARTAAGRVARLNVTVIDPRKQRTETATGFKSRLVWVTRGAPDTEIAALRPAGRVGLTAIGSYWEREANWLGKEES